MTRYPSEFNDAQIDFFQYNSQSTDIISYESIDLTKIGLGSLMKELDTASSFIIYMRTLTGSCNKLCIYNYIRKELNCKEFDNSITITDLLFSPFAF